jgi:hypothetical protein
MISFPTRSPPAMNSPSGIKANFIPFISLLCVGLFLYEGVLFFCDFAMLSKFFRITVSNSVGILTFPASFFLIFQ